MAQVKIYGLEKNIEANRAVISESIHRSVMTALEYPPEKKFHRFIRLDPEDFIHPDDRSEKYTIIEISMFKGRTESAKKTLIREIFANLSEVAAIQPQDVEITIFETPTANWGIRGMPGDELALNYKIEV